MSKKDHKERMQACTPKGDSKEPASVWTWKGVSLQSLFRVSKN